VGYALARRKLVIVVGKAENIFHRGACVVVEDFEEALSVLAEAEERMCDECGDDIALPGFLYCSECLESNSPATGRPVAL